MNNGKQVPTPGQVHAWLRTHGWTPEDPLPTDPEEGVRFTYKELSDDGQEIWIVAPRSVQKPPWYPLLVRDVVVTAAGMEDRPEADVLAEMLAVDSTPASQSPPVPVA